MTPQPQLAPTFRESAVDVDGMRRRVEPWMLVLVLPFILHFSFSWIGFNPTDDGWLPAVAKRLALGEWPHRDFISVRPVLSALMQVPLVWWAGDHLIALSRFVGWCEVSVIAWIWTGLLWTGKHRGGTRVALFLGAAALTAHSYPIMAWHSIDGLLFVSLGAKLLMEDKPLGRGVAFALVGVAALCRQNFVFVLPVFALALPSWRHWPSIAWAGVAPGIYFGAMLLAGALPDALHQLLSTGGAFWTVAVVRWLSALTFVAGAAGGALMSIKVRDGRLLSWIWAAVGVFLMFDLAAGSYYGRGSVLLFGWAVGAGAVRIWRGEVVRERRLIILVVGIAWATAISIGYNSPGLAGGALWLLLLSFDRAVVTRWIPWLATAAVVGMGAVRILAPYRDRPAWQLTADLGEILPGARGILTSPDVATVIRDLRSLLDRHAAAGAPVVVLTDYSAIWLDPKLRNPLPAEWPQATELGESAELRARVVQSALTLPRDTRIITQRHAASELALGLVDVELMRDYYAAQFEVSRHLDLVEESPYFAVYRRPDPP